MDKKMIYTCEYCGKEFSTIDECQEHEIFCKQIIDEFSTLISKFLQKIIQEYNINTQKKQVMSYIINNNICCNIKYLGTLANGHQITIDERINLDEINNFKSDVIQYIKHLNTNQYIGEVNVTTEDFGYNTYTIGDIDILDILQDLKGKKIKIEVLN